MHYFISKNMIIHVEDCYWGMNASYSYNIMGNIKKGATLCEHCKHKYHYLINLEKSIIFLKEKEMKYWLVDDQLFFRPQSRYGVLI